jgi:nitroreductase
VAILNEKTVREAIDYRRSVRAFTDEDLEDEKVKDCIYQATLAPTSSNLQLWEFYHVTDPAVCREISIACFDQGASRSAKHLVVVVARRDLWRSRARANYHYLSQAFEKSDGFSDSRKKMALNYYRRLIPTLYSTFFGLKGWAVYVFAQVVGLFRPMYRQTRRSDLRVVAQKSAGLAAQNFMNAMASIGYDTCPMEGHDSLRVKRALDIPRKAEINMVIGCGIRDPKGVYGKRFRIPFMEVYKKV